MLSVEAQLADGRVRVMEARAVPAESAGPVRFAVGAVMRRPAAGESGDDLMALALASGVVPQADTAERAPGPGAEGPAELLRRAEDARQSEERRGLVQVFRTSPSTVARVAALDDLGKVAAGLNILSRSGGSEVFYADRWAAAAVMGRGDAF